VNEALIGDGASVHQSSSIGSVCRTGSYVASLVLERSKRAAIVGAGSGFLS